MAELGVSRSDTLLAVGGGSLSDAAGFAAATFLRGIEAVYVSTTLLGAVDASIGGKTGVNLGAKNLIGAFRHPARVIIDVDLLDRLPEAARRSGMAEALKAGLVGDSVLVELLERDRLGADLEEVIGRAVAVKAGVVGRDFEEAGERAHLNYGHTVGHGVEVAGGYGHGDAVAIGMVAAGRASAIEVGFVGEERQREAIGGLGLPIAAPGLDRQAVLALLRADKKRDAAGLRMVLLERIGTPTVGHVGSATVEAALTAVEIA
jgi:3-dehydroquinate synthase